MASHYYATAGTTGTIFDATCVGGVKKAEFSESNTEANAVYNVEFIVRYVIDESAWSGFCCGDIWVLGVAVSIVSLSNVNNKPHVF